MHPKFFWTVNTPNLEGDAYIPVLVYCHGIVNNSPHLILKCLDLGDELNSHHSSVPLRSDNTNLENFADVVLLYFRFTRAIGQVTSTRWSEAWWERNG